MGVLVCAATRAELAACQRGIAASRMGAHFETLRTGVGPEKAARNLETWLKRGTQPALVVSSGFAGALSARLAVGDWVTARSLASVEDGGHAALAVPLREALSPAIPCDLVSASEVVDGVDSLPASAGTPDAVDMESAALGRVAGRLGTPLMVLRVVSDTPAHPLPPFLGAFGRAMAATRRADAVGHVARGIGQALGDPGGIARIVRDGSELTRALARGWESLAERVLEVANAPLAAASRRAEERAP